MSDEIRSIKKPKPRSLMAWFPDGEMPEDIWTDPLFIGLVLKLPKAGGVWLKRDREAWLMMFNAVADGAYPESKSGEFDSGTLVHGEAEVDRPLHQEIPTFVEQRPYKGEEGAAGVVVEMTKQVGKPAHVWFNRNDGRIRLCKDDYQGTDGEMLLGVYDVTVKPSRIKADIKAARAEFAGTPATKAIVA